MSMAHTVNNFYGLLDATTETYATFCLSSRLCSCRLSTVGTTSSYTAVESRVRRGLLHFLLKQIPQMHPNMNVNMKVRRNVTSVADINATTSMLSFSSERVTVESNTTELQKNITL
jgi:hypothetical protein